MKSLSLKLLFTIFFLAVMVGVAAESLADERAEPPECQQMLTD